MKRSQLLWTVALALFVGLGIGIGPLAAQDIFVPAPKDADESLDKDARPGGGSSSNEVVITRQGDRLVGRVGDIIIGGKLRLTGPQFVGEALVMSDQLKEVTLSGVSRDAGPDEISLTSGDRLVGELTAITADWVVMESPSMGPVKISRKVVQAVTLGGTRSGIIESRFGQGQTKPFQTYGDTWSIADGMLRCIPKSGNCVVYTRVEKLAPITVEVDMRGYQGNTIYCYLALFSDNANSSYGNNSAFIELRSGQLRMQYAYHGSRSISSKSINSNLKSAVIRFAYDPSSRKAQVWLDGKQMGEYAVPGGWNPGRYVMLRPVHPCQIKSMRVMHGIVPPSGRPAAGGGGGGTHTVEMAGKNRVTAKSVTMAEGAFTIETPHGRITPPIKDIRSIVFGKAGLEQPRRRSGDVRVETAGSRMVLQFQKLTRDYLVGYSEYMGAIKIQRDAVKRIQFNIYK